MAHRWSSPEQTLLLACAELDQAAQLADEALIDLLSQVNWARLVHLAARHSLTAALVHFVNSRFPSDPRLIELRGQASAVAFQNLALLATTCRVTEEFRRAGIPCATFKGPVLAYMLHGIATCRPSGDIDLFIPRERFSDAIRLLSRLGFSSQYSLLQLAPMLLQFENEASVRDSCGIEVDLHWDISPRRLAIRVNHAEVWQRTAMIETAAGTAPVFALEDYIVLLAIHSWKHGWVSLHWLADIAGLLRRAEPLRCEAALENATRWRARRVLLASMYLAAELFAVSLPATMRQSVAEDRKLEMLCRQIVDSLFYDMKAGELEKYRRLLCFRESCADRLKFMAEMIVLPTAAELYGLHLPRGTHLLYLPYRFARVALTPLRKLLFG